MTTHFNRLHGCIECFALTIRNWIVVVCLQTIKRHARRDKARIVITAIRAGHKIKAKDAALTEAIEKATDDLVGHPEIHFVNVEVRHLGRYELLEV
jgi:hypothetical protein